MKTKALLLILGLAILLLSCIKENDNLVNPPPKANDVLVRFLNLAGSDDERVFIWERSLESAPTSYAQVSPSINPPADSSSFVEIRRSGALEYESNYRITSYIRNASYTFIAIPRPNNEMVGNNVDTVIYMNTTTAVPQNSELAYIRLFNAVPDSNAIYALRLGCPSGEFIIPYMRFGQRTSRATEARSGQYVVSLVKKANNQAEEELINLFQVDLSVQGQYMFVVVPTESGEELHLLDELDPEASALQKLNTVEQRNTYMRVISYSNSPVDIRTEGGIEIVAGQSKDQISNYYELTACQSQTADKFEILTGGELASTDSISLGVLENYTMFVFDSQESQASTSIIVPPTFRNRATDQSASVRVINGAPNSPELALSIAARNDTTDGEIISGIRIANNLFFGQMSEARLVPEGLTPLSLFTAFAPAKLLRSVYFNFEANKNYVVVVTEDATGRLKISIIEDSQEMDMVEYRTDGMFLQLVNLVEGQEQAVVSSDNSVIDNINLQYEQSLATVFSEGQNTIIFNGMPYTFEAIADELGMLIAYGSENDFEMLDFSRVTMGEGNASYRRRVINLSDIQIVGVKEILADYEGNLGPFFSVVERNTASAPTQVTVEKKVTLYFFNAEEENLDPEYEGVFKLTDVTFNFGKNYTIIFYGPNENGEYGTLIQQEY